MAHINPNPKPVPPQQGVTAHPKATVYHLTFAFLLFMLVVTVGLYYVDLSKGPLGAITGINLIVALIVAVLKASSVVLFFMNVRNGTKLTYLWAALGFIWALLMGGIFMDYQTRHWVFHQGWN